LIAFSPVSASEPAAHGVTTDGSVISAVLSDEVWHCLCCQSLSVCSTWITSLVKVLGISQLQHFVNTGNQSINF